MSVAAAPSNKLGFVQALRAVAASLVVVDHSLLELIKRGSLPADWSRLAWTLGDTGVYAFFVISGFIMVHTAGDEFGKPRGPVRFMLRRLARIVPLYWLFLVFAVAREWRHGPLDLGWVAASFAFLPHLNPAGLVRPVLGVGWTLNFEMLFYVLFAGALFMPKRQGLVALFSTLAALVAFGVVLRPESAAFATWTSPVVLLFAAGAGLALFKLPMPPLEVPTLSKLGDASYATYLVHGFLLGLTAKLCPPLLYVPAMLVVANVAGLVVHVTVEKRLARWLKPRVEPAPLKAAA